MDLSWQLAIAAFLILAGLVLAARLYGGSRWRSRTSALRNGMEAARVPIQPGAVDFRELEGLPQPVQRYFRAVLTEGQPFVAAVEVEQTGTFNLSAGAESSDALPAERWKPFTAVQRVTTRRPGFLWDARVRMAPGLSAFVCDAYVAGEGVLVGKLLGLLPLVEVRGTDEFAVAELMRFFAEAAWYPTALLPSQGVRWEATDGASANAVMRDGDITIKALVRFDEEGLIESLSMERGRLVAGQSIPTLWEGHYRSYELREGMRVPTEAEVRWLLPSGPQPYCRGRITSLDYELAP